MLTSTRMNTLCCYTPQEVSPNQKYAGLQATTNLLVANGEFALGLFVGIREGLQFLDCLALENR